ncbi:MAG: zf-HC2 domain-containing protein [Paraclostridium sp.]
MSKVSCDVIKDLIPLYYDDICSKDTRHLVDNHIKECQCCSEELKQLNSNIDFKIEMNQEKDKAVIKSLSNIWKKENRKSLFKGAMYAIIATVTVALLYFGYLNMREKMLLKDAFIFDINNVSNIMVYKGEGKEDDYDYKISNKLASDISKTIESSGKIEISENQIPTSSTLTKSIDISLDGGEINTDEGMRLVSKRLIRLRKLANSTKVYVTVDINKVTEGQGWMTVLASKSYIIESKELSNYIDQICE